MKQQEISISGIVNSDGKLSMYMGELNEFLKENKNHKVVATFVILKKDASAALKGYYFNYVVPTFKNAIWQNGERKTEEQTEIFLRSISPIMNISKVDKNGNYDNDLKKVNDLSNSELIEHIDTLKQIAAEEYGVFIDDPKTF